MDEIGGGNNLRQDAMVLTRTKHEKLSLKHEPTFSEAWLHDQIADDPSMFGLGELDVIDRERVQYAAGRLDLLLSNSDLNRRYEVEIMLGPTNPDHIVRCIEYWDIERRRYPAYDHIAVVVAEDITTRFLNVMGLLAGSIPLIAIQLNALRVGEHLVLDFVRVLDQTDLRRDDESEAAGDEVDRNYWEQRVGQPILAIGDQLARLVNETNTIAFQLKYRKRHIAVSEEGSFFNLMRMIPRRKFVQLDVPLEQPESWIGPLEEAGLPVTNTGRRQGLRLTLAPNDLGKHQELLQQLINQCVADYQGQRG